MSASPPPMEVTTRHCGHCGAAATQHCAGCRNIKYCNKQCQTQDWRLHKHLCKTYANFATPPGPNLRRIIILPEDANKPYFKWMKTYKIDGREEYEDVDAIDDELGVRCYDVEEGGEIGEYLDVFGESVSVEHAFNIVLGPRCKGELLDHSINMLCRCDTCPFKVNQCLDNLTLGHAKWMGILGRGDKAIFAMSKVAQSTFVRDVDCSDLTLAINGWVDYERRSAASFAWLKSKPGDPLPAPKADALGGLQYDSSEDEVSENDSRGRGESVRDLAGSRPASPSGLERLSEDGIKPSVVEAFLARFEDEDSDDSSAGEEEETVEGQMEGAQ
ncbi:hypothetical protein PRZ48_004202 [Zasmidium cellare]|uniref:MYND-type domain-containing protein n=1 Tax=Zasmidium cellare TaxID=395010 RepID=A0ABR0EX71_ZASCE|nr:hypothetical protein PRZ48_004202 [Zasmidium cellare]